MAQNILAFVGENENGILRDVSLGFMSTAEPYGVKGHLVDLLQPDWGAKADEVIREGVLVAIGFAGVGSQIEVHGRNFWDAIGVPFVSILSDPPAWLPTAHKPNSNMVALGYVFDEWLDIQRRFIKSPSLCARVPNCVMPNPLHSATPWNKRSHRMVLVKTGASPDARRASWKAYPKRLREVLEDAADEACRQGTMGLTDLLLGVLDAHDLCLDERSDILFRVMFELDMFVRMERATRMVKALCHFPAEIIGRGWDHIDKSKAKAKFYPATDASTLPKLTADTQFTVNSAPNVGSSVHERITAGFAARACVVSDHNAYTRANYQEVPSFLGLEWHQDDLVDQLAAIWNSSTDYGDATEPAYQLANTVHAPLNLIMAAVELAEILRFSQPQQ